MFYPRYMFHVSSTPIRVDTQEELDALGHGWANSPEEAAGYKPEQPAEDPAITAEVNAEIERLMVAATSVEEQ
jgi:hypothetical protein